MLDALLASTSHLHNARMRPFCIQICIGLVCNIIGNTHFVNGQCSFYGMK